MSLNLLEPILEESLIEEPQDEKFHWICPPCNSVQTPLMLTLCGHWDEVVPGSASVSGMEKCDTCDELIVKRTCIKGHSY